MDVGPALHVRNLTKSFRGKRVVDGVDLTVERGEILGFLGPNGAGKTTVMNMIMGLVRPDGGEIELLGVRGGARDRDLRLRVGYLQEKPRIYPEMTGRAYLDFFARLHGVPEPDRRVAAALDRVGLTDAADRILATYSRGMQQRACLARVMLHQPVLLLLDEPTLGLDPLGVAEMRDILREMREGGVTLLFSSHQLAEMERICDRVAFMKQGRVVAAGRPADLAPTRSAPGVFEVEVHEPVGPVLDAIRGLAGVAAVREIARCRIEVALRTPTPVDSREARAALARDLTGLGLTVLTVGGASPTLEDLFLALAESNQTMQ
ncbi:ABC transporter ATP-binding protein [Arenibaculum pallidiluteum]|uniref:ABC transporter ATP-binding protein n=1 Tax=Arenibaculum pallidiluteum TaxID=2812559 RepID=UPI001A97A8FE|nr:ABC transporter ATP-binding protein [Arenibaculum pallidiluteum]